MWFIGTAGWSISRENSPLFPTEGTHLHRYAKRFDAVEINSSFYRPHQPKTYARWADSVPADFRFSVKIPRAITHERRLRGTEPLLSEFLQAVTHLGEKLGVLLIQLPPSLGFDARSATRFFQELRDAYSGSLALEPRHASWGTEPVDELLEQYRICRVFADPEAASPNPASAERGFQYFRLHGSPRIYYSSYEDAVLREIGQRLAASSGGEAWCIFDNTAEGWAIRDGLKMRSLLEEPELAKSGPSLAHPGGSTPHRPGHNAAR